MKGIGIMAMVSTMTVLFVLRNMKICELILNMKNKETFGEIHGTVLYYVRDNLSYVFGHTSAVLEPLNDDVERIEKTSWNA